MSCRRRGYNGTNRRSGAKRPVNQGNIARGPGPVHPPGASGALLGGGGAAGSDSATQFALKCRRCGEIVRVRADPRYDLEQEFGEDGDNVAGYTLHKEVLGQRCPQLMRVTIRYDRGRRELEREAEGGDFVPLEQT